MQKMRECERERERDREGDTLQSIWDTKQNFTLKILPDQFDFTIYFDVFPYLPFSLWFMKRDIHQSEPHMSVIHPFHV